jgi:20S proteasome alpha/beta subunit
MMNFPKTYIDRSEEILQSFSSNLIIYHPVKGDSKTIDTGTTIVSLMSPDKKVGLVASDGRVSAGYFSVDENFQKIFDCRIGFIGVAGALGLLQQLIPAFRLDLDNICDSRGEAMTASGGARRLFQYYQAMAMRAANSEFQFQTALIALFWDSEEKRCHLYKMQGMSFLTAERYATIGSGATSSVESDLRLAEQNKLLPVTLEEMKKEAARLIKKASNWDKGTNDRIFYGIIDNGIFTEWRKEASDDRD